MAGTRRRRFPTVSLFVGLAMLVASPLGWAWLQYDLYREEEDLLAELKRARIDHDAERGVFLAQEPGDTAEDMWEIMTETWRAEADRRFPWLRPLHYVYVHEPISLDLAKRIASLPRVSDVGFYPAPEGVPPRPTLAEVGLDLGELAKTVLVEPDLNQPIPTGRTLVAEELPELEADLSEAWTRFRGSPLSNRFAVSIALSPYKIVGRVVVDGERRKHVSHLAGPSDAVEISVRTGGEWRGVSRPIDHGSLSIQTMPEEYYFFADYRSYPPYLQPELFGYWDPAAPPSTPLAAGIEYAEELPSGAYAIRFRPFDRPVSPERNGEPIGDDEVRVQTMTVVVRPDMNWCVERGEAEFAGARGVEWLSRLERHGDQVVVGEQLYREFDSNIPVGTRALSQTQHAAFDWELNPKLAADEFSLSSAGAGPLGPPREIPWYRHWYLASALAGLLVTVYVLLRIVGQRLLMRRELRATMAVQSQSTSA